MTFIVRPVEVDSSVRATLRIVFGCGLIEMDGRSAHFISSFGNETVKKIMVLNAQKTFVTDWTKRRGCDFL